ncbi:helix-turn-helix domain-containing protein [Nordella sp. HKS 07]|uniref:helix-turn-helix domain-containing protein n=1 Tax=Nordella sp. HKS 07 TaxID=2712222 RepID=UPI0013E1EBAA|nr:helix-turn-helix domain-containing protein [Nordella sp. HKS 07]QIG50583.1 helix-turn-helix domain-containing protein [Nordella sp. HKS 07]
MREAADILGLSAETLKSWRHAGVGPEVVKYGRAVRITVGALRKLIAGHKAS